MQKIIKYSFGVIGLILTLISTKLYALENQEQINVNIKRNIKVRQNGKELFKVADVLVKDNEIYISLESLEGLVGENICYKDNTISVESELDLERQNNQEEGYLTLDKAKIISINIMEKEITVLPYNESNEPSNYITLKLDETSEIIYKEINKSIPLNMLSEEMIVSIEYEAFRKEDSVNYKLIKIAVLEDTKNKEDIDVMIEGIEIIELALDKGYIKVAYSHTDKEHIDNQIIIHIDLNTNIKDTNNISYTLEDLKVGQKIKVVTNGILTASIPPQTLGLDIIIMRESTD